MKVKKLIEVEIEVDPRDQTVCGARCLFLGGEGDGVLLVHDRLCRLYQTPIGCGRKRVEECVRNFGS